MKFFLFLIVLLTTMPAISQPKQTWKICLNKAVVFSGNDEMNMPEVTLRAEQIINDPNATISINFKQAEASKTWKRDFFIQDDKDQTLHTVTLNVQQGIVAFPASIIKDMAKSHTPVYIYTTSLPKDQKLASTIRVRRVLLSKIAWK